MRRQDLFRFISKLDRRGQPDLWVQPASIAALQLFAVTVRLEVEALGEIVASSVADTEQLAIDKALFEAIERYAVRLHFKEISNLKSFEPISLLKRFCFKRTPSLLLHEEDEPFLLSDTTSGCAIHSNPRLSVANALAELLERHTVLAAQLQGIPGKLICGPLEFSREGSSGIMRCFAWQGPLGYFVIMCEIRKKNSPHRLFGFGAHRKLHLALQKAKNEGVLVSSNIFDFQIKNGESGIFDLMHWHYHNDKSERFYESSTSLESIPSIDSKIQLNDFYFIRRFVKPGFYLSRVISPSVQILHTKLWESAHVNPRFREIAQGAGLERPYAY